MDCKWIKYNDLMTDLQEVFSEAFNKATSQLERRIDTLLEKIKELNCKHAFICDKCGKMFYTDDDTFYDMQICEKCFSEQDKIEITMWRN